MQIPPAESLGGHFLSIALPIILAFAGHAYFSWRGDQKKERKKAQEVLEKDNQLALLLREYKLHYHKENTGALHAEAIRYPQSE